MAYQNPYFDKKLIYQNAGSGLASGASAGPDQFYMDNGGMLGSVASGFANGGPIGGVVAGVTDFFKQDAQLKNNIKDVNTAFNGEVDMYGRPVYNSQEFSQGFQDLRGLSEATRPGAHPMRARRRRQAEQKLGQLYQGIQQGQQNYNHAEAGYRDRQLQLQDYYQRQNDQLYNIY